MCIIFRVHLCTYVCVCLYEGCVCLCVQRLVYRCIYIQICFVIYVCLWVCVRAFVCTYSIIYYMHLCNLYMHALIQHYANYWSNMYALRMRACILCVCMHGIVFMLCCHTNISIQIHAHTNTHTHANTYKHLHTPHKHLHTHPHPHKEMIPPATSWILVPCAEVQRTHLIGRYLVISLFGKHLCQRHTNSKGDYCNDKRVLDDTSNDVLYVGVWERWRPREEKEVEGRRKWCWENRGKDSTQEWTQIRNLLRTTVHTMQQPHLQWNCTHVWHKTSQVTCSQGLNWYRHVQMLELLLYYVRTVGD